MYWINNAVMKKNLVILILKKEMEYILRFYTFITTPHDLARQF